MEEEKHRQEEVRKRLEHGELVEFSELRKVKEEKHKLQKEVSFPYVTYCKVKSSVALKMVFLNGKLFE